MSITRYQRRSIIGFRRSKSLKDILVRAKVPQIKNKGCCGPCKGPKCEICIHIVPTRNFTSSTTKRTLVINNTQKVQRNLGQGLINIGVRIVTIVKTGKLSKSHFTLILQMVVIKVKVTGK